MTWYPLGPHLVIGQLPSHRVLVKLNSLKEPFSSVPDELWQLVDREVGTFPARLQDLIRAFSNCGDQIPPFLDLLKVFCGGSLLHKCSFCDENLTVAAVAPDPNGVSSVLLQPHFPLLFACSATSCVEQMSSQHSIFGKWMTAVLPTHGKLMVCDHCFKRAEKVHRLCHHTFN